MRKLSEQNRRYFRKQSIVGGRRKHRAHQLAMRLKAGLADFLHLRRQLPGSRLSITDVPGYVSFDPPEVFDIYENYEATMAFLLDIRSLYLLVPPRQRQGRPFFANFSRIKELEAASGLLLAAEIDRWCWAARFKPVSNDHLWDEGVRDFFHDAGLFDLLRIDPKSARSTRRAGPRRHTLPFRTGTFHEGAKAVQFRDELESIIGKPLGPRARVYDAISEAMTNVPSHAYPRESNFWPVPPRNRWWLGGSWLPDHGIATVQIYDHGVGIPRTLPKSRHWSELIPIIGRLDRERTDAGMIEAAMEYGRTSTLERGRGKGLAQMAEWIRTAGNGSLRILSGRGALTFLPGKAPLRRDLPVEFRGTLVEWTAHL